MHHPRLPLWPICFLFLSLFVHANEPFVLSHAGERKAWETLVAKFNEPATVKKERSFVEVSVKGLKAKPTDSSTASVRVDPATGHVIEVVANGANFADADFAFFGNFPELRALTLWHNGGAAFNGSGLAHVLALPKLEKVTLAGGSLSDVGMTQLGKIKTLRDFSAWHAAYTDAGVAALANHPSLESVRVGPQWKPTVTDKSVQVFASCPKLSRLGIDETYLTWEGGLRHLLDRRETLRSIDLGSCVLDPADIERLRQSLPKVTIQWKGLASAGAIFHQQPKTRTAAEQWMPKELVARAVAEAEKAQPASAGQP